MIGPLEAFLTIDHYGQFSNSLLSMDNYLMNTKKSVPAQEGRVAAVLGISQDWLQFFTKSEIKVKGQKSRFRTFGVHWTPGSFCLPACRVSLSLDT